MNIFKKIIAKLTEVSLENQTFNPDQTQPMRIPAIESPREQEWEPEEFLHLTRENINMLLANLGPDYQRTHPETWEYAKKTLETSTNKEPTEEDIIKQIKKILKARKDLDLPELTQ